MIDEIRISQLLEMAADAFGMNNGRRERFLRSRSAKLVAVIPFASRASQPDRLALSHLAIFVIACSGDSRFVFDHTPDDDASPFVRLAPIADCPGGDPATVRAGLARLALMMLAGYEKDRDDDRDAGIYNPITSRKWQTDAIRAELRAAASIPAPELDGVITVEEAVKIWWDW